MPDGWRQVDLSVLDTLVRLPVGENVVRDEFSIWRPVPFTATSVATPPTVRLVNETKVEGLAAAIRDQLRSELDVPVDIEVDRSAKTNRRRTTIEPNRNTTLAQRVARALRTQYRFPPATWPGDPAGPDVIVYLGTDRMR